MASKRRQSCIGIVSKENFTYRPKGMLWKKTSPDCGVDPKRYALKRGEGRCGPPLVSRLNIQFAVLSRLVNTSSGKRVPRIAFAGGLETLSSQESASGTKIQLSERSEFCIFVPAFSRFLQA
jgi:hypothetical protein